jgi:hypothetical protein
MGGDYLGNEYQDWIPVFTGMTDEIQWVLDSELSSGGETL